MNNTIIVSNIQRFSLSDGNGIRTTIFLKGCPLHCPWCANPENISFDIQKYYDLDNNCEGQYGINMSLSEIFDQIMKDKNYYGNDGGVTFSGGEPLIHINKLLPLLKKLKENKINICFETSLFVHNDFLIEAIKYADYFIVDLKMINEELCKNIIGGQLMLYKNNVDTLFKMVNSDIIIFRIPVTNEYTLIYKDDYINFLKKYKPSRVEIFRLHNLAEKKYKNLNIPMNSFSFVDDNDIEKLKNDISKICDVQVLRF